MINLAKFSIIGRIGSVHDTGKVAYVSLASDYTARDDAGNWHKQTDWSSVTVFSDNLRKRLANGGGRVGNLIAIEGPDQDEQLRQGRRDALPDGPDRDRDGGCCISPARMAAKMTPQRNWSGGPQGPRSFH